MSKKLLECTILALVLTIFATSEEIVVVVVVLKPSKRDTIS
jgi:hypothetical protein